MRGRVSGGVPAAAAGGGLPRQLGHLGGARGAAAGPGHDRAEARPHPGLGGRGRASLHGGDQEEVQQVNQRQACTVIV